MINYRSSLLGSTPSVLLNPTPLGPIQATELRSKSGRIKEVSSLSLGKHGGFRRQGGGSGRETGRGRNGVSRSNYWMAGKYGLDLCVQSRRIHVPGLRLRAGIPERAGLPLCISRLAFCFSFSTAMGSLDMAVDSDTTRIDDSDGRGSGASLFINKNYIGLFSCPPPLPSADSQPASMRWDARSPPSQVTSPPQSIFPGSLR